VDSRSAVNLIGPHMVRQLGLKPRPVTGKSWNLRVASDHLVPITEEVEMKVNVAGVVTKTVACVLGVGVAYDLLLSRSWMEDIGTIEDFKRKKFTIAGVNEQRIEVPPTPEELCKKCSAEEGLRYIQEDLEEQKAEEEIDNVFEELDKNLLGIEPGQSEND
jgi:hypothetical protein